jgi:hypothetical protein
MSQRLCEIKQQLAKKYERLARLTKSQVKRKTFNHKAATYRFQAEQLARL